MVLLQTQQLTIGYKQGRNEKIIQTNINVSLKGGEIHVLMGQNGVGKTTFIKTLIGILPSLQGQVFLKEQTLGSVSLENLAKQVAVVLTEKPASMHLSVTDLIALGRFPYSSWMGKLAEHDKEAIQRAIDLTEINYIAHKKINELSDGQLQKVMIARALAQDTDIIILDEPASHLDLHNKIAIMNLLRQIASTGKAILISTHDLQLSLQLADKIWLFDFNREVVEGLPEELVLNGKLERALYLKGQQYDMMYGRVYFAPKRKTTISIISEDFLLYWTRHALNRLGYAVVDKGDISIYINENCWVIENRQFGCLSDLLDYILATLD